MDIIYELAGGHSHKETVVLHMNTLHTQYINHRRLWTHEESLQKKNFPKL